MAQGLLLCPGQVITREQEAQRQTPASSPSGPTVTAPVALQRAHVQGAIPHHCHRQDTASWGTRSREGQTLSDTGTQIY